MKKTPALILLFSLFLASSSLGQDSRVAPAPALGTELPYTEVLAPPMPVSERMPLAFSTENPPQNFLTMGFEVGTAFDDNALLTSSDRSSNLSYILLPSIEIGQSRSRLRWDLAYHPGFTVNQQVSERNEFAQGLSFVFDYRLTSHVGLRLREGFEKTNNAFSGVVQGPQPPGTLPVQTPNFSAVTPLAELTSNTSAVDLTYQSGANSVVGASGNYYLTNYNHDASGTIGLIDSNSVGADGFYAHRFANRHWAGLMYNFQRLQFQPGNRTNVHQTPLFYAVSIGTHTVLSVWAGPEYSITPQAVTASTPGRSDSRWAAMGGADLSWQGARTTLRAGYLQQTTDGGGLAEAVVLKELRAEVHRRLTTRWTLTADLARSQDDPLYPTSAFSPYRTWTGGTGFEYAFTDRWMMRLRYDREHLYSDTNPSISPTNRNRVLISFGYSFSRPLGR